MTVNAQIESVLEELLGRFPRCLFRASSIPDEDESGSIEMGVFGVPEDLVEAVYSAIAEADWRLFQHGGPSLVPVVRDLATTAAYYPELTALLGMAWDTREAGGNDTKWASDSDDAIGRDTVTADPDQWFAMAA